MPPRKKITVDAPAPSKDGKRLTEESWVVCDISVLSGAYYITAEDEDVNLHDVWFAPEGVKSLDSDQIQLLAEDVTLDAALSFLAPKVKSDLASLPTTPQAPKPAAAKPKATKAPAKKAAVKKPSVAKKSVTAPAKSVPTKAAKKPVKKAAAKRVTRTTK